jgi:hypothetical protein
MSSPRQDPGVSNLKATWRHTQTGFEEKKDRLVFKGNAGWYGNWMRVAQLYLSHNVSHKWEYGYNMHEPRSTTAKAASSLNSEGPKPRSPDSNFRRTFCTLPPYVIDSSWIRVRIMTPWGSRNHSSNLGVLALENRDLKVLGSETGEPVTN